MADSFGSFLKGLREGSGLSLRAVEKDCSVSNGYLSLLENDKVKDPSPRILWKLAQCYHVPYVDVLARAGYPIPAEGTVPGVVFRGAERLNEDERAEIQDIIKMKLNRRGERL